MNFPRTLFLGLALLLCGAATAAEPVVILHDDATRSDARHGNAVEIQQNYGARCEAPALGSCGSCAVSCPVGQAATCRPGKAVGKGEDASCLREPACTCR